MRFWLIPFLMLLSGNLILAQPKSSNWVFGAGIEAQKSTLEVFTSDWQRLGLIDLAGVETIEKIGGTFHLDVNYQLGFKSSLRFSPGFFLQHNEIKFQLTDQQPVSVRVFPLALTFPFYYQYAPQGLFTGPRFFVGAELQKLLGLPDNEHLSMYNYNVQGKIGVALPIKTNWIKWIPSLTYGMGLENIKKFEEGGKLNSAVEAIQMNTIQFGVGIFFVKDKNEKVD